MDDLATLVQIAAVYAVAIVPFVLVIRFVAGRDPDPAGDSVALGTTLSWPRGVQEEDPRPWRFAPLAA